MNYLIKKAISSFLVITLLNLNMALAQGEATILKPEKQSSSVDYEKEEKVNQNIKKSNSLSNTDALGIAVGAAGVGVFFYVLCELMDSLSGKS